MVVPDGWPIHSNGDPVTHLYRLVDDDNGTDSYPAEISEAMSHTLLIEGPGHGTCHFRDKIAEQQALQPAELQLRVHQSTALEAADAAH